ncbi:primosomal protein N' (replication factor Y) - superfamily II helicase [Sedimentitalea sp. CY04]|uniref:Primosomal protein N' (Replication factor Y) -superfamily II helicase n=1 Tax=Parasedimentitalea denitrificans TaxID=2211118 RepID=A0ABX0W5D8_9RHOB|nr:primosomal protein N' (replication factor Y) - superfamily II helicase [Sedimentitalea sp. CY04]NIZ60163.1 primosomal protein N' (replication factor Y) - superfamily II helicase [Sedimentitalea sp. CY04]
MTTPPPPPASSDSTSAPHEAHLFPCEQCGSDYRYDPKNRTLTCDHCGHTDQIGGGPWEGAGLRELDFETAVAHQLPEAEIEVTRVSSCPSCAAQVEFDPNTHAKECPFCATPVVVDTGENRHIKPKGVLPFGVDERSAHKEMSAWLGKLWFAPNGLKEYARKGRKMEGIYVPYWTFDADTKSSYTGQRGTVYYVTETRVVDGKTESHQVAKVRWTPAAGRVKRWFDDVLVLASKSLPKSYTEALEPWDLSSLEPYQPQYLAGFRAEAYAIELEDGYTEAREKMDRVIERDVRFDIGGDRQRIHDINTTVADVTFKHVLLPVWLAAYKYRGKTYRFVVNGQSGRVQGERPYSAWKIAGAVAVGLIVAAGIGYLAAQQ